jgi:hypothetical protein
MAGSGEPFDHSLTFDSEFESGNLLRAVQRGNSTYDLFLRSGTYPHNYESREDNLCLYPSFLFSLVFQINNVCRCLLHTLQLLHCFLMQSYRLMDSNCCYAFLLFSSSLTLPYPLLPYTPQIFTQKVTRSGSTSQCRTHTLHKPFSSRNRGSKFRLLECALILLTSPNRIVCSTQVRVKAQSH